MKRLFLFLLALGLALGAFASAEEKTAPEYAYSLPEGMKTVSATLEGAGTPEIPGPVRVLTFTEEEGEVSLELDAEVPKLVIRELNFMDGTESTIYSKKNVASVRTHAAGKQTTVFTAVMTFPLEGGAVMEREYNTWFGTLSFAGQTVTVPLDAAAFEPYTKAERVLTYSEEGRALSDTVTASADGESVSREAVYGEDGALVSVSVSWKKGEDVLEARVTAEGEIIRLLNVKDSKGLRAFSQDPALDVNAIGGVREEVFDPWSFDEQLLAYPRLTAPAPSTATDLAPATATDLAPSTATDQGPATVTDLAAAEPLPEGTRLWALNYGDYTEASVYAFLTADPMFVYENGTAGLNAGAKDVNGKGLKLKKGQDAETPSFELPEIR